MSKIQAHESAIFKYMFKKSYYWKNNLAYTEDHVLIKKLFLSNMFQKISKDQLKNYFSKFGDVVEVSIYYQNVPRTGTVCFADASSAAKALNCKFHYINKQRLHVKASHSWHQPDFEQMDSEAGQTIEGESIDQEEAPIMRLNDYCLEHIIRCLNLQDRIKFTRVCKRFKDIYCGMSPIVHRSINFSELAFMSLWELRDFFTLSGAHIRILKGMMFENYRNQLCTYIGLNCINLESLILMNTMMSSNNIKKILLRLENLQTLHARACGIGDLSVMDIANSLKNLKELDLSMNKFLTGEHLFMLPKTIEVLCLENCKQLKWELFEICCQALPHLKELRMRSVYILPSIENIVNKKGLQSLESLTIGNYNNDLLSDSNLEAIALLPSLKKLILTDETHARVVSALVVHKSQQLEHLEIHNSRRISIPEVSDICKLSALRTLIVPGMVNDAALKIMCALSNLKEIDMKNSPVSDEAVIALLVSCRKLCLLHLNRCELITDQLTYSITKRMQSKDCFGRVLPIKINADIVEATDKVDRNIVQLSNSQDMYPEYNFMWELENDLESDEYDSFDSEFSNFDDSDFDIDSDDMEFFA